MLSPTEKKGHTLMAPKLRGVAVGPMLSRLFDIMTDYRFSLWYSPNPNQAGSRKKQGCNIQIFALFLVLDMAKCLGKTVFIGLLDFEKAYDYVNRPALMTSMMDDGIGATFLKNLNNMYEQINYLTKTSSRMMDDPIISDHGVTQGRNSSSNIFSYYISDMNDPLENQGYDDFMKINLLQLADDSVLLAENIASLVSKFEKILHYCDLNFIIVNMMKTNFMEFSEKPRTESIQVNGRNIAPVDPNTGYSWLGFYLTYSSEIQKLVERNIKKKKCNIAKFYAWLKINEDTPFPFKLKVLHSCLLAAILHSCETWGDLESHREELLLIERNALRAILGVKDSTPEDLIYVETDRTDIMIHIILRQYNFFQGFKNLTAQEAIAKEIWDIYSQMPVHGPMFEYYESLSSPSPEGDMNARKTRIRNSDKSMHVRYNNLIGCDYCEILYTR